MQIRSTDTPALPPGLLEQMGFQLHAPSTHPASASTELAPQESVLMQRLQTEAWQPSHVRVEQADGSPLQIEVEQLNRNQLLSSLYHMARNFNVESATALQSSVQELLHTMRSQQNLPHEAKTFLVLTAEDGTEIHIDTATLARENLLQAFTTSAEQLTPAMMQATHHALGEMAVELTESFRSQRETPPPALWEQFQHLTDENRPFEANAFTQSLLGFDPFNEEQSVLHLFQEIAEPRRFTQSYVPVQEQADLEGLQLDPALFNLSEQTLALIRAADALEATLNLAPKPNSPDVLSLFRQFAEIVRELDIAMNELLTQEADRLKRDRGILKGFAEQLHRSHNYQQEALNQLHNNARERFRYGLHKILDKLFTKVSLVAKVLPPNTLPANALHLASTGEELSAMLQRLQATLQTQSQRLAPAPLLV
jgi:hypothetical protein